MTTDLVPADPADVTMPDAADLKAALAHYLVTGDLSEMRGEQRLALYFEICRSMSISPRTRPLHFIEFYDARAKRNVLMLYPTHEAADQLAYLHRIRVRTVEEKTVGTLYKLVLEGTLPDGRTEENVAYVSLTDAQGQLLTGQRYGDALMKARTKCKRRLVLGMVGFNLPFAAETLERGRRVLLDPAGEVMRHPTEEQTYLAEHPQVAGIIGEATWEDQALPAMGLEAEPVLAPVPDPGPPARSGPRPTLQPTPEERARWNRQWHATVDGTSLGSDEGRHRFFEQWTAQYTEGLRTDSSSVFFARATRRQADELLAHADVLASEERAQLQQQADDEAGQEGTRESRPKGTRLSRDPEEPF